MAGSGKSSRHPSEIRLYADFNNADRLGRVRLNTQGTQDDLTALGIRLEDGMRVVLDEQDEIVAPGTVRWDDVEGWVAEVDWPTIHARRRQPPG